MDKFITRTKKQKSNSNWQDHVTSLQQSKSGKYSASCKYCELSWQNIGADRIRAHLGRQKHPNIGKCSKAPDDVVALFSGKQENVIQSKIQEHFKSNLSNQADKAVATFFYANGIPFNVAQSPEYQNMINSVLQAGKGYVPPKRDRLRRGLLNDAYDEIQENLKVLHDAGKSTGYSLSSDGYSDESRRPLINFMVNSASGTYFLESVDTSGQVKTSNYIAEITKEQIKKHFKDEENKKQIIIIVNDNASQCVSSGKLLEQAYPHITWVGCLAHGLNLLLKDIFQLDWAENCAKNAKLIVKFIRVHQQTTFLLRKYSQKELIMPGDTRFMSSVLMIGRLLLLQKNVQKVVKDKEWHEMKKRCDNQKQNEIKVIKDLVLGRTEEGLAMWEDMEILQQICDPICALLRLADGDAPCTQYVYYAMFQIQEFLKEIDLSNVRKNEINEIFFQRWDFIHSHLYSAAYALSPIYISHDVKDNAEINEGLQIMIEKLSKDDQNSQIALAQFQKYKQQVGSIGTERARKASNIMEPHEWWMTFGYNFPELQIVAIKVLAAIPTASPWERNWSTYEFIHSKKRNKLNFDTARKLVSIFQNIRAVRKFKEENKNLKISKKARELFSLQKINNIDNDSSQNTNCSSNSDSQINQNNSDIIEIGSSSGEYNMEEYEDEDEFEFSYGEEFL